MEAGNSGAFQMCTRFDFRRIPFFTQLCLCVMMVESMFVIHWGSRMT